MGSKDKRIVELEFDNKSFEAGVKKTLSTLESLDKNLENLDGKTLKGLQNSLNDISFKEIGNGVDSLKDRFSAFGTFAGRIVENLADSVYNLGKKMMSNTFGQIMSGGSKRSLNIKQANFMWRGLWAEGRSEEELSKMLKLAEQNVNDSVVNTAYGFDEAALASAQLAASGVQLGDDMTESLQSISGLAAMTGSEFSDIAHIFTTVAGNGRLMGEQLNQIGIRGINAAAELAEYLGTSEEEVRDLVSKGAIGFDTFAAAMHKFWYQAEKANDLYSGALSNVKAALSRLGQPIYDVYYDVARDVLNAIRPIINAFKTSMTPTFEFFDKTLRDAAKKIVDTLNIFDDVEKKVLKPEWQEIFDDIAVIIKNVFGIVWDFVEIIVKFGTTVSKVFGEIFGKDIIKTLVAVTGKIKDFFDIVAGNDSTFNGLYLILKSIFTSIKYGYSIIKNLLSLLYPIVSTVLGPIFNFLLRTVPAVLEKVAEKILWLTQLFAKIKEVKIFGMTIEEVFGKVKDAINKFTDVAVEKIYWFFDNLNLLPGYVVELWDTVKNFASNTFKKVVTFFGDFGDALKSVKDQLKDSKIVNKLKEIFDRIKDFMSTITFTDVLYAIAGAFIYFKDTLKDVYDFLKPIFESLFDTIKHFVTEGKELLLGTLEGEAGGNLLSGGILATLVLLFTKLRDITKNLSFEGITKSAIGVLNEFRGVLDSYQKSLESDRLWNIAKAIALLAGSIIALTLVDDAKLVQATAVLLTLGAGLAIFLKNFSLTQKSQTVGDALKQFSQSVGEGIRSFLNNVGSALASAIKVDSLMLALDMFAFALLELAGTLKILSTIEWPQLSNALLAMLACAMLLGSVLIGVKYLSDQMDGKQVGKFAGLSAALAVLFLGLSTSMVIFASALAIFASTYEKHDNGFKVGLVTMGFVVGGIVAAIIILQKYFKTDYAGRLIAFSLSFLVLAGSITVLALGMSSLAGAFALLDLISWEGIAKGIVTLLTITTVISAAAQTIEKNWKSVIAFAAAVTIISFAMYPLIGAIVLLNQIQWEAFAKLATVMGIVAIAIVGVAAGFAAAAKLFEKAQDGLQAFGDAAQSFGVGVLAFSVGVLILVAALGLLATAGPIIKTAAAVLVEGITAFFTALANSAGELGSAVERLATSLIENILKSIKNAMGPMLSMLGEIIVNALDNLIKYAGPIIDKVVTLIVDVLHRLSERIPELVDAVFEFLETFVKAVADHLGELDVGKTLLVTTFTVALGALIKWFGKIAKDAKKALVTVGVIGLLLAEVTIALLLLSAIDTPNMITSAASLVGVTITLGVVFKMLSSLQSDTKRAMSSVIAIGLLLGEMVLAFLVISTVDTGTIIAIAQSLVQVALSMSLAIRAFKNIDLKTAAWAGLAFDIFTGIVTVMVGVIGWIGQIEGMADIIKTGAKILKTVGQAIGDFIGGILGGIAGGIIEGIGDALPTLGEGLSGFMEKAQPFFDNIKTLSDSGILDAARNLSETLLIFGGAEIINAIANFLGGEDDFQTMGDNLVAFGGVLVDFYDAISGLDDDAINKLSVASEAAKNLAMVAEYAPKKDGIWQDIMGVTDIEGFSKSIETYGTSLLAFAGTAMLLTDDHINGISKAVDAGLSLTDFADTVPKTGGIWQDIAGEKDLAEFSNKINVFGLGLLTFAGTAMLLTDDGIAAIGRAVTAAQSISDLNSTIPTEGGVWQLLSGEKDIMMWGAQLVGFGKFMKQFYEEVRNLPKGVVDKAKLAAEAGTPLAELNNTIPTYGGLWGIIAGNKDMGKFGDSLSAYGKGLSQFSTDTGEIDKEKIQNAAEATLMLVDMNNAINASQGEGDFLSNLGDWLLGFDTSAVSLGQVFGTMGEALGSFSEKVSTVDFNAVSDANYKIKDLVTTFGNIGPEITTSASNFNTAIETLATDSIEKFITTFANSVTKVTTAINTFITSVTTFIKSKNATLKEAGRSNANAYVTGLTNLSGQYWNVFTSFYNLGQNAINGFISGLRSKSADLSMSAWSIARLAYEKAKEALEVESPSKLFMYLGEMSDKGLANGLTKFSDVVADASTGVANTAYDSVKDSIYKISSLIDEGVDINPTITPVMDLSNIQNGIGSISDMFYGIDSSAVNVLGPAPGFVNGDPRIFNDSRVVESIENLTNKVDNLSKDMSNMKVLINGRALVGEIAPMMNEELGAISTMANRGV